MNIFIDEVGYLTDSVKRATVTQEGRYSVVNMASNELVYEADAVYFGEDETSGDNCYIFDFTTVCTPGSYIIRNADSASATFTVSENVYDKLMKDMLKCFYYQRCGCELKAEHAGEYTHACCHSNPSIFIQDYVDKRTNAPKFDMTGGWHDAGDFGKYVSPAAVAVGHLLYSYELYKDAVSMNLNIPESGNAMPDILNEVKYELDWMFKMQAENGGLYHKVTTFNHVAFMMPEYDLDQMLIYPISSMATADFAAMMAMVSRIYRPYDEQYADKALLAARRAFAWLCENDFTGFTNPAGSNTGQYGDFSDADERMWAAAEMLRTDIGGDVNLYRQVLEKYVFSDMPKTDFGWTDVSGFALISVLTDGNHAAGADVERVFYEALFKEADRLVALMKDTGYELAMETDDFVWGSNLTITNRGILFDIAKWAIENREEASDYAQFDAKTYTMAALNHLHYLLGRNALGRSYVTGHGEHAFKNPHNRTTACDGIEDPMAGWVSGGPFKDFVDKDALVLLKKGTAPQKCHADVVGSYSTNEITIYWNASAILHLAGLL